MRWRETTRRNSIMQMIKRWRGCSRKNRAFSGNNTSSRNQEGEDWLDQHKDFSFNELGVHSEGRQGTQQHLDGTETSK